MKLRLLDFTAGKKTREAKQKEIKGDGLEGAEMRGRREAEGLVRGKDLGIEALRAVEQEKEGRSRRSRREVGETLTMGGQIVTLTNEKGVLIKVISVGEERMEEVEAVYVMET